MWWGEAFSSISLFNKKFLILSFQAEIAAVRDEALVQVMGQSWWEYSSTVQGHIPRGYFLLLDRGFVCMWFYTFYEDRNNQGINLTLLPSALVILTQLLRETSAVDMVCRNIPDEHCEIFLWLCKSNYKKAPFPWHSTCSMLPTFKAKWTSPCEKPEKSGAYPSSNTALHHLPRAKQKWEGADILKETT